jgi:hypothetical protein
MSANATATIAPAAFHLGHMGAIAFFGFLMITQAISINKARSGKQSKGFGYTMMVLTLVIEILAVVYFVVQYLKASGAAAAIRAAANARFRGAPAPAPAM